VVALTQGNGHTKHIQFEMTGEYALYHEEINSHVSTSTSTSKILKNESLKPFTITIQAISYAPRNRLLN
jgi:hypothetical protein